MFLEALISYLVGSLNFSYFIGKFHGIDLSKHWDKNLGATNLYLALRDKGVKFYKLWYLFAGLLDVLKGLIPALIFDPISSSFAVLGHCFSVFSYKKTRRIPTGAGLSPSLGWHLVYTPQVILIFLPLEILYIKFIPAALNKKRDEYGTFLIHIYSFLWYIFLYGPARNIILGGLMVITFSWISRILRFREYIFSKND